MTITEAQIYKKMDNSKDFIETLDMLAAGLTPENYRPNKMSRCDKFIFWASCCIFYGGVGFAFYKLATLILC